MLVQSGEIFLRERQADCFPLLPILPHLLAADDHVLLTALRFSYDFVDLKFEDDPRLNLSELNAFINQTEELVRRIIKFAKKESLFQV